MRAGKLNSSLRTQCQVAVSGSHAQWFLLNASSDLRMQIVGAAELDSRGQLCEPEAVGEKGARKALSHASHLRCPPHQGSDPGQHAHQVQIFFRALLNVRNL